MNLPVESNPKNRKTIRIGECLQDISLENFLNFVKVAAERTNLDISKAKI